MQPPISLLLVSKEQVSYRVESDTSAFLYVSVEGSGERSFHVEVEDKAECHILLVENTQAGEELVLNAESSLGQEARVYWHCVNVGKGKVEQHLRSHVRGANADSTVDWLAYARGSERMTLTVRNIFHAENGTGEITMKGIAEEKGHITCKGMIEIGLQGRGTNTYLTQEVLMLDATAKVDAVPGLEIQTNDVKASHSATIARVTPEDLFYFGSRGIPEREARRMFVLGFLGDLVEELPEGEREVLLQLIEQKYGV